MTTVPQAPRVNLCRSCNNLALDERNEWYCVSKASRDVTINCLSLTDMYTKSLCGPKVNWKQWEQKR